MEGKKLVCVGDVISANTIKAGIKPDIIVFDQKKYRNRVDAKTRRILDNYPGKLVRVKNPPGTITKELWRAIRRVLESKETVKIQVEGEEDLAVAPFVMESDSDTVILYGLMDQGFVLVNVNKDVKEKVKLLLERMEGR
ncbi:MAG: GTP-dependent dephospho-CoA kinase family protein [Candidatus Aenigmarchaeota archaeon]|nr:GTP-dependent dephospho-CoA kinase family protein [Candidatus Aenigmarchaeota archaeon]